MTVESGRRWGPIPYILTLWCVSRVILTGVGVVAEHYGVFQTNPPSMRNPDDYGWLTVWCAWDSGWYHSIANEGYPDTPIDGRRSHWAFFPLYPWVTRAVAAVIGDIYVAALLVSNAALLIGAWVFYKLVAQRHDDAMARKAVLCLFSFPTAYIFSCLMTEGLFLAVSVGAWYAARQGNWLLASVLGMASSMTRMVGLLMAPLLALEYLRQRRWRLARIRPDVLWIGLVPVGLGVFMATGYLLTGNPWQFSDAQNAWTTSRENPLGVLWWTLKTVWTGRFVAATTDQAIGYKEIPGLSYGAIATIAVTVVLLWGRKRIGNPLFLWSMGVMLISLSAHITSAYSMPRYLAVLFPVWMILASLRTTSVTFAITVAAMSLLQAATFAFWTLGWAVAM